VPVPDAAPGKVIITAEAVTIQPDQAGFSLLDGVSAQTEFGEPVAVWVVENGGFRADTAGAYSVTYGAFEEGELVTATRVVTVEGEVTETTEQEEPNRDRQQQNEMISCWRTQGGWRPTQRGGCRADSRYSAKVQQAMAENEKLGFCAYRNGERNGRGTSTRKTYSRPGDQGDELVGCAAIFLAQNVSDEENPLNVAQLCATRGRLDALFLGHEPSGHVTAWMNVKCSAQRKSLQDMVDEYNMSAKRSDFSYELMQPGFTEHLLL
jgi:hypothetical protein